MKYYAFIPFWYWANIMDERPEYDYVLGNIVRTQSASLVLTLYAETRCPASQLVEANSEKELEEKIDEIIENFQNSKFIKELEKYL